MLFHSVPSASRASRHFAVFGTHCSTLIVEPSLLTTHICQTFRVACLAERHKRRWFRP